MGGFAKIGGTTYTIMRGKTKIGGSEFTIFGGKTKIDGTSRVIDFGKVPAGYRRVKWIEARAKGPYIVLPFTSQIGLKATFEFALSDEYFLALTDARYYNTWGRYNSNADYRQYFSMYKASGASSLPRLLLNYGSVQARISDVSLEANTLYEASIVTRGAYPNTGFCSITFNGQTISNVDIGDTGRGLTGGGEMRLFTLKDFGATSDKYPGPGMFGRMTFYDSSDAVICDLWPCYRSSDSAPGYWDSVSETFLTNQGSGSLFSGPTIIS